MEASRVQAIATPASDLGLGGESARDGELASGFTGPDSAKRQSGDSAAEHPTSASGNATGASTLESLRLQVVDEEEKERGGLPSSSGEWRGSLDFLVDSIRQTEVENALRQFDSEMRRLQREAFEGSISPEVFSASWDSLIAARERALLEVLNPTERSQWHSTVGAESEALRDMPTGFDEETLGRVAAILHSSSAHKIEISQSDGKSATLMGLRDAELLQILGEEGLARLQRAMDPRYDSYVEMTKELQLPQTWADFLFDCELYFARVQLDAAEGGLRTEDLDPHLRAVARQLLGDLRSSLDDSLIERLLATPQTWFLAARIERARE